MGSGERGGKGRAIQRLGRGQGRATALFILFCFWLCCPGDAQLVRVAPSLTLSLQSI